MTAVALAGAAPATGSPEPDVDGLDYFPIFTVARLLALVRRRLEAASAADGSERTEAMLDAFLCVASLCQVAADQLHRDIGDLRRIARYASRLPRPAGPAASSGLHALGRVARRLSATEIDELGAWQADLEQFASSIADQVWGPDDCADGTDTLRRRWSQLSLRPASVPSDSVAIPPRCFFSFDQRPEDCTELAARFAAMHRSHDQGVLVIGVRTSGCFMAPIVGAGLKRQGFRNVWWTSWRPGQPLLPHDRANLARAVKTESWVVVVDDPPTSGGSYARVAQDVVRAGVSHDQISLLVPALSMDGPWRDRLRRWDTIILPFDEWRIQRLLSESAVARALDLGGYGHMERVTRAGIDSDDPASVRPSARKHVRARYRVLVRDRDGQRRERDVFVHGIGLGLFGAYAARISSRLDGLVAATHTTGDGLLYREWLPDGMRVDERGATQRERLAVHVARYAARRAAELPVPKLASLYMSGHDGLWEQAGRWLGDGFGRLALPLRPLLHAAGRRLLASAHPSLIDGAMGPGRWFDAGGAVLKTGSEEGAFVYQLPLTYDAAYDVAAAAAYRLPDRRFGATARSAFESATGRPIDDHRWFLNGILSQIDARNQALRESKRAPIAEVLTDGERRISLLHREFLCGLCLDDHAPLESGALCAIDVDGVLENARAGYSAPSQAAVLALRALAAHGYRGLIVTGRSLGESVERCRDYRLAGAVAEYGGAVYDAVSGRVDVLIDEPAVATLARLREALASETDVEIDPAFQQSVRAFVARDAGRRAIPTATAERAVRAAGVEGRVRVVQGWAQTDFVPVGVDKGTGLRQLLTRLTGGSESRLALAVGDSLPDLPMFELANLAVAPANADPQIGRLPGVRRARHRYGAGLADAVGMLVGHRPGGCPACALKSGHMDGDVELLLALLEVGDFQGLRKLPAIARAIGLGRRLRL